MLIGQRKIDYVVSVTGLKTKCATRRIFFIFYFYINKNENAQNNKHDFMMKQSALFTYIWNIKTSQHTVVFKNTNS